MVKRLSLNLKRDEFNDKIGGGIPSESLILIEGEDGSGKSIIAQRCTYGFLKNGISVSYISSELDTAGFVSQMDSLNYEVTDYLLDDKLTFISMFPSIGNVKLKDDFMDALFAAKQIFKKDVIIIDSLSFMMLHREVSVARSFDVVQWLKKLIVNGKTVIFCIDPNAINTELLRIFQAISDIYFMVEQKTLYGDTIRTIKVQRFKRAFAPIASDIAFKVDPGRGFATILASLA